jgi:hypothetical protein
MPFIDTRELNVIERLPGWHGRYFHSPSMTFAHYDFMRGASIHEHFHPQEEVYEVVEGELEITVDGETQIVRPGLVAMVPECAPFCQSANRRPRHHRGLSAETRFLAAVGSIRIDLRRMAGCRLLRTVCKVWHMSQSADNRLTIK